MKILLLEWEYIANASRHYFYKELSRQAEVVKYPFINLNRRIFPMNIPYHKYITYALVSPYRLLTLPKYLGGLRKIVKKERPDVLYFNERFANRVRYGKIGVGNVAKAIYMLDPPRGDYSQLMNFLKLNSVDIAFYENSLWEKDLPDMRKILMPWSVDTNVFRDYKLLPKYDVVASGILSLFYPVRYKVKKMMESSENMKYQEYPNFAPFIGRKMDMEKYFLEYAKFLSSSKIFIFHPGYSGRTVAKYAEGLASSSLMMAPMPFGGEFIHLVPGENFVEVSEENFAEKISFYLENEGERIKIAKRGIETARKYLDVKDSVSQFIRDLEKI